MADRLRSLTARATSPAATVDALLTVREVFGEDLPHDPVFRALVTEALTALARDGVRGAVRSLDLT
jgi:fructuronate reductase